MDLCWESKVSAVNMPSRLEATVRTGDEATDFIFPDLELSTSRLSIVILLIELIYRVHHEKC